MIEVCIVDDEKELRDSLCVLFRGTDGFSCAGAYENCETALEHLDDILPDVLLMDIELKSKMSGVAGVKAIKDMYPEIEIIMLTIHEDNDLVFESLCNGASGYLVKHVEPADLLNAIKEVDRGGAPMSMRIARMVTESFRRVEPVEELSRREKEVLEKVCEGKSNKAIAQDLFVSTNTVKFHVRNIYRKLQVANRTGAVLKAMNLHHRLRE